MMDEISFGSIWKLLVGGWRWILLGAVAGLVSAGSYLAVTEPEYEAVALIQIQQTMQLGQRPQVATSEFAPVEAPARVVDRIMFPTFQQAVTEKLGWASDSNEGKLLRESLKAIVTRGGELVELRVRAYTADSASRAVTAVIDYLASSHKAMAEPAADAVRGELKDLSDEIVSNEKQLLQLQQAAASSRDPISHSIWQAQIIASKENRINDLKQKRLQYREWTVGRSLSTRSAEPIWVSGKPVWPKRKSVFLLGWLGGMFVGVVSLAISRTLKELQAR